MSSITATIKGYGKITPNPPPPAPNLRRRNIIAVTVTLTLVLAAIAAVLIYHTATESESAEALKTVCSKTTYPTTCLASLDATAENAPATTLSFLNLSLHVSISHLSSIRKTLPSDSSNAAKDCADLFDQAATQLENCAGLLSSVDRNSKLTDDEKAIGDLKTWISAAMTDEETCLDGFEEMGAADAPAVGDVRSEVKKSQEFLSNTLAILNHLGQLYHELEG